MAVYAPVSALGWLDLDAAASDRAAALLRAFEEPGILDPLGLGSVRDLFSELLVPGTSTTQTRLRYFLFVPWICQGIERDRVSTAEFAARLRGDEAQLIDCLRPLGSNQGVQGYSAGRELKRMPSEAYWGGLGSWGLRRLDLSISEYGRRIGHFSRRQVEFDDDRNPVIRSTTMWAHLPEPPASFLRADVGFDLTVDEARLLVDHIHRHHPGSLLAEGCRFPAAAAEANLPWDLPVERLSPPLREALHHARCVSELTLGPQHVYNLLLARRASSELGWDTEDLTARIEGDVAAWIDLVTGRAGELVQWADDLAGFWRFASPYDTIAAPTQAFITEVVTRAAADPEGFIEEPLVHSLIRDREIRLKSSRARLGSRSALEGWDKVRLGGPLVYRWPTARSYLADLDAALAGDL